MARHLVAYSTIKKNFHKIIKNHSTNNTAVLYVCSTRLKKHSTLIMQFVYSDDNKSTIILGASVCVCVSLRFDSNYLPVNKHQQGEVLLAMTAQTLTDWTWDDHDNPVAMPTSLYPNKESDYKAPADNKYSTTPH